MMIDPTNITNYEQNQYQLEEVLLFWVCVAGKTSHVIVRQLDLVLREVYKKLPRKKKNATPFEAIRAVSDLSKLLKSVGMGCYNQKAKSLISLVNSGLDLKTCTVSDLEKIYGIGPKTSRCFLLHSRPNQEIAALDTHILRYMREKGYDVPKSTPSGSQYKKVEKIWLGHAQLISNRTGQSLAEIDLEIWNKYSGKD